MLKNCKTLYSLLMRNSDFLEFFIRSPLEAINGFDINQEQKEILLVRCVDELPALAIKGSVKSPIEDYEW